MLVQHELDAVRHALSRTRGARVHQHRGVERRSGSTEPQWFAGADAEDLRIELAVQVAHAQRVHPEPCSRQSPLEVVAVEPDMVGLAKAPHPFIDRRARILIGRSVTDPWNLHNRYATGGKHPADFAHGQQVVGNVLEHMEADQYTHAGVSERQLRKARLHVHRAVVGSGVEVQAEVDRSSCAGELLDSRRGVRRRGDINDVARRCGYLECRQDSDKGTVALEAPAVHATGIRTPCWSGRQHAGDTADRAEDGRRTTHGSPSSNLVG